jgi:mycothiol synthase
MTKSTETFTFRHPSLEEVPEIADLLIAAELHDWGEAHYTVADVRDELSAIHLETDAWVAEDADGRLVGVAELMRQGGGLRWQADLVVHPEWRRRGIGATLARQVEARARERVEEAPEGTEVILRGWVKGGSPAREWAEGLGFTATRQALRMDIEMTQQPPAPEVPAGIRIREFVTGVDERPTFEAIEAAFADHWGHVPSTYEDFLLRTKAANFDAQLWLLADADGEIVGTTFGVNEPSGGWVTAVGTIRAWRGRGVATALMREIFVRFWARGVRKVGLGVDSDSLTGATRLYERLGMRVTKCFEQMTKILRAGRDLSTREIAPG